MKIRPTVLAESVRADQLLLFPPSLGWAHYLFLLKVGNPDARAFYEIEALRECWSARELERQIASLLYERLAKSRDKASPLSTTRRLSTTVPLSPYGFRRSPLSSSTSTAPCLRIEVSPSRPRSAANSWVTTTSSGFAAKEPGLMPNTCSFACALLQARPRLPRNSDSVVGCRQHPSQSGARSTPGCPSFGREGDDFTSCELQRELCEHFVASRAADRWVVLPERFAGHAVSAAPWPRCPAHRGSSTPAQGQG